MKLWVFISWLFLLFIAPSVGEFDASRARAPLGPLGVTLDFVFATNWPRKTTDIENRNWSWSSHLVFNQPVHELFSERELWAIGWHAYQEMRGDIVQYEMDPYDEFVTPRALSVLAWGSEIILVSSQKGKQSFSYKTPNTVVLRDLNICAAAWREEGNQKQPKHKSQGKCGEEMAAHLFGLFNRDQELRTRNPSINTWAVPPNTDLWDTPLAVPPCGDPKQWGCDRFVTQHGLRPLPLSAAPSNAELFAMHPWEGKEFTVNQFQLCGRVRYTKGWN